MKKALSFVLAAIIMVSALLSLASCGSADITGTWKTTIDFEKIIGAESEDDSESSLPIDLSAFKGKTVDLFITFKEDGTFTETADKDQLKDLIDPMAEALTSMAEAYGISMDELLEGYSSVEEMIEKEFMSGAGNSLEQSGKYTFDGSELNIEGSVYKAERADNTFTISEVVSSADTAEDSGDAAFEKEILPLVFTLEEPAEK